MNDDAAFRFQTYLNYVSAISDYLMAFNHSPAQMFKDVIDGKDFQAIQGGRYDRSIEQQIGQLLRNAWFTELQIVIAGQNDKYVSYSNHWTPVQLYYVVYLAARAYFVASGQQLPEKHAKTLRTIAEMLDKRPLLFPHPWNIICVDDPKDDCFRNIPNGAKINSKSLSPLTRNKNVNFLDRYGGFLRTTRDRDLHDKCEEWKYKNKRKKIDHTTRQKLVSELHPTSIFNCLYRMRIRSNYRDADAFLLSIQSSTDAMEFHSSLQNIAWYLLLSLELLIARSIKKKNYEQIVTEFHLPSTQELIVQTVERRWEIIQQLF